MKRTDNSKLGKYGQGSKLLYTLLTEVSESEENEDLLIKTLYDEKKGPYLISWYNRNQLANLLQKQGVWTPAQGDDYKENILFAKIMMSYYPVAPGTSEDIFSTKEALDAIEAFDNLVDPRRNLHFLDKGAEEKDFANDDDTWSEEVEAMRKICVMNGIDPLVERSRSGRGAHVWIFFDKPIAASLVRKFGFALLDKGAEQVNLKSFKYYDRMLPAQDSLPDNSALGNLIALPLQGKALQEGNSAFVDGKT